MWNQYYLAANLEDVLDLLSDREHESRIISGGTDLMLEMERGIHNKIDTLIDISRIQGLDQIELGKDGAVHIGALVTHNQIVRSDLIRKHATCLQEASYQVGSPQIRNRGTVAGNLITASPANDTIPALIALDAEILLVSKHGQKQVKVEDIYTGVRKTILKEDEVLKEIIIKVDPEPNKSTFYKFALRNAQAISLLNAAVFVQNDGNIIRDTRIAVGAVAPTVVRLKKLESTIRNLTFKQVNNLDFTDLLLEISPIDDIRSSSKFRTEILETIVKRCFEDLSQTQEISQKVPIKPVTLEGKLEKLPIPMEKTELIDQSHPIETRINGKIFQFFGALNKSLLNLIREDAELIGTKEGCAEGECGACTIFLDERAVMSCLVPAPRAHKTEIITIEGLSSEKELHRVQEAFIEEGAVQCGYCTPGFVMSAVKLLDENAQPNEDEIKQAITGNLCRCTGYYKIIRAIETAALREKG